MRYSITMMRTHTCGELAKKDWGKEVTLCGWVHAMRNHGGVLFIDLRDRYGLTQIVFNPSDKEIHDIASTLKREYVIKIKGKIAERAGGKNAKLATGEVEVVCNSIEILNESMVLPMEIEEETTTTEDTRLKYRYLDLRRRCMVDRIVLRNNIRQAVRTYMIGKGFLEIETPMLIRSTPEGARDFIVPSRIYPGKVYALPQSPQLYKQLLMVSGLDRYFQFATCFRDEDSRADRQPMFTQIDVEMSFVDEEDIYSVIEGMMKEACKVAGFDIKIPFQRIKFEESIDRYGIDKPDLRFGMEIIQLEEVLKESEFNIFKQTLIEGGWIRALVAKGCASYSRKEIDALTEYIKIFKAGGLIYLKVADSKLEGSITKYLPEGMQKALLDKTGAKTGDLILIVAGKQKVVADSLGNLRNELAKKMKIIPDQELKFCWVTEFPMFEWNEDDNCWDAKHHLFTAPKEDEMHFLEKDPARVHGRLYDLVLNGVEIASGSIRINRPDVQKRIFNVIKLTDEEAEHKFGFLMEAFKYGAPPHGGIAPGFDRLVMILAKCATIRDVIAFPYNKFAQNPMDGCPSDAEDKQMKELHINFTADVKK